MESSHRKAELIIIRNDPWLDNYANTILFRHKHTVAKEAELCESEGSIVSFANAHDFYGLHSCQGGWVFREWAPNAVSIHLIGDFSQWKAIDKYALNKIGNGVWELKLGAEDIKHGDYYKMLVCWDGGSGERIPAYATRVVQDENTKIFSAQVWTPQPYKWKNKHFHSANEPLLIYECHIGMAQEKEGVSSYVEFRDKILPRIAAGGYNAIQLMAIQEHPYYGSFGYHVSNFFAPSSRFGTPEELKSLIDKSHELGLAVIMDIVHSHAVKNEREGIARIDGSSDLYFHSSINRRMHPAWDSLCFNYGKNEVLRFLLSNCKYWIQEYKFDGFRFDGVTSMIYNNHGLGQSFTSYEDYYNGEQDIDAITYLSLANKLIHKLNPKAITIAEEMSGMPGVAAPINHGGMGFDYRMAMGIPDYWIKIIKEKKDEDWKPSSILRELINRRNDEKTISYVESHDQALVGDKTIIFRLIDKEMYWHMKKDDDNMIVARGMALHKMIRLITASTINGGYLNFMGNEFGHPEWIDFPRVANGWSYKYARRQWTLVDNDELKYCELNTFDNEMLRLIRNERKFNSLPLKKLCENDYDQVVAYMRGNLVFVFNFNPTKAFTGYGIFAPAGEYEVVLSTDNPIFGGYGNIDETVKHITQPEIASPNVIRENEWLKVYLPPRSAQVLRLIHTKSKRKSMKCKQC